MIETQITTLEALWGCPSENVHFFPLLQPEPLDLLKCSEMVARLREVEGLARATESQVSRDYENDTLKDPKHSLT